MTHTVTIMELNEFLDDKRVSFAKSIGNGRSKEITVDMFENYYVYKNKNFVLETMFPKKAIEKYNSLP